MDAPVLKIDTYSENDTEYELFISDNTSHGLAMHYIQAFSSQPQDFVLFTGGGVVRIKNVLITKVVWNTTRCAWRVVLEKGGKIWKAT